ncbi:protein-methionine-sulfoxide reductase heme-binding subunit MsrQ [Pseudaestuariivita atlantica]|uniref:Protein-methionine-sulfoxide reductase heme-binding subunit MsrQ n=1 Tax=Pseudaestuariivita atlantica TaxID=1317121 RepID=A0A0L1JT13_9RHOB|nr:sulfite oxidase [Pseudaestuariivita atlantica]
MIAVVNSGARRVPTWLVYALAVVPPVWLFYAGLTGGLGIDPVKAMEQQMGLLGLQLFIATLCITPLRRFAGINLIRFRRALGLITFFYILCHLLVWLVLDVQILSQIIADIYKRPYITVGMAAFVLMIPLAITSNNMSVRRMGAAAWNRLHWLTYPAVILGGVHYVMLVKGWQIQPLIYLGVILGLLALRQVPRRR